MKRDALFLRILAAGAMLVTVNGCQSTGNDATSPGSYYDGGLNDPWYYGAYDDDIDVVVPPPERPTAPPQPTHPIVLPPPPRPTPMPSIPRMPAPRAR
jgi:hypothetical protein